MGKWSTGWRRSVIKNTTLRYRELNERTRLGLNLLALEP
jgi:hypothetical protein